MRWNEVYPKGTQPDLHEISTYIHSAFWEDLCTHLETVYGVSPKVEHSICSAAPGWNVKYKKSSRSLCTLYPDKDFFTAMVSVGSREATEAELLLSKCTAYTKQLYWNANPFNGARWLMIEVRTPEILDDVKQLIALRVPSTKVLSATK